MLSIEISHLNFILQAVLVGDPRMVQLLLHHLDNKNLVNIPDRSGKTPLIYAIKNENMPILEIFVKEQYLNLDQPDKVMRQIFEIFTKT